jgi:hypothetical protein
MKKQFESILENSLGAGLIILVNYSTKIVYKLFTKLVDYHSASLNWGR